MAQPHTPATPEPPDRTSTRAGTGGGTAGRPGTNVHGAVVVDMAMEEYTAALARLPSYIAHFIEYEATESYNPLQILEFMADDPFLTWGDIFRMLKEASRNGHRASFGGVHPALDPPRRVW